MYVVNEKWCEANKEIEELVLHNWYRVSYRSGNIATTYKPFICRNSRLFSKENRNDSQLNSRCVCIFKFLKVPSERIKRNCVSSLCRPVVAWQKSGISRKSIESTVTSSHSNWLFVKISLEISNSSICIDRRSLQKCMFGFELYQWGEGLQFVQCAKNVSIEADGLIEFSQCLLSPSRKKMPNIDIRQSNSKLNAEQLSVCIILFRKTNRFAVFHSWCGEMYAFLSHLFTVVSISLLSSFAAAKYCTNFFFFFCRTIRGFVIETASPRNRCAIVFAEKSSFHSVANSDE